MSQSKVMLIMFGSIFLFTSAWVMTWAIYFKNPTHQATFSSSATHSEQLLRSFDEER